MFSWLFNEPLESFRQGELALRHPLHLELLLLLSGAICFAAWWTYRRESRLRNPAVRLVLIALRVIGIVLVIAALLGPILKIRSHEQNAGIVAVGVDFSRSMTLANGKSGTRFDAARALLSPEGALVNKLAAAGIKLRVFAFGSGTRQVPLEDLPAAQPTDDNTNIGAAIGAIAQSTRNLPLQSVILMTDGDDTTSNDPAAMAALLTSRHATLHTIGIGQQSDVPDVEVVSASGPRKVEKGSLVEVTALIRRGSVKGPLQATLFQGATALKTENIPESASGEAVKVKLGYIADKPGSAMLTVKVPPAPGEANLANNEKTLEVEVAETRVEVLLVEGSPRHEFAFIRRAMRDNPNFRVVSLLRFGHGRYYEPNDDEDLTINGFPATAENLGRFKAIILSDVEAGMFTAAQLDLIKDFVRVRGGGLLMLGGVDSFNLGGYQNSPMADLLPVYLTPDSVGSMFDDSEFTVQLTPQGASHEILRLDADPTENTAQWALMPKLRGFNPLYMAKPGATVLASGATPGPGGQLPIMLAVQDVGAGRAAAFAPANSWLWRMQRPSEDDTFARFWSQMIRWLAVGSKENLAISTSTDTVSLRTPITLTAVVLDKTHRPTNDAKVSAQIKDSFGNVTTLPLLLSDDGVYKGTLRPTTAGNYDATVKAGLASGNLEKITSFFAAELSNEFARTTLDGTMLEQLAAAGHGTCDLNGNADKAIEQILAMAQQQKNLDLVTEKDLRDAPILLIAIALAWFTEWFVRKRNGLA